MYASRAVLTMKLAARTSPSAAVLLATRLTTTTTVRLEALQPEAHTRLGGSTRVQDDPAHPVRAGGSVRRLTQSACWRVEAHAALGTKVGAAGIQYRAGSPEAVRAPSAIKVKQAAGQDHQSQRGHRQQCGLGLAFAASEQVAQRSRNCHYSETDTRGSKATALATLQACPDRLGDTTLVHERRWYRDGRAGCRRIHINYTAAGDVVAPRREWRRSIHKARKRSLSLASTGARAVSFSNASIAAAIQSMSAYPRATCTV